MVLNPQRAATEYLILKKWAPLSTIQFPLSIELSRCFLLHLAVINWLSIPGFGLYSRRRVTAWKRVVRFREKTKKRPQQSCRYFLLPTGSQKPLTSLVRCWAWDVEEPRLAPFTERSIVGLHCAGAPVPKGLPSSKLLSEGIAHNSLLV